MSVFNLQEEVGLELVDETFREGIERSIVPIPTKDKLQLLLKLIHSGVKSFVLGIGPSDMSLLKECVSLQEAGEIPGDVKFIYIVLLNVWETTVQNLEAMFTKEQIGKVVISLGMVCYRSEENLFSKVLVELEAIGMVRESARISILNSFELSGALTEKAYQRIAEQIVVAKALGIKTVRINDSTGKLNPDDVTCLFTRLHQQFNDIHFCLHTHNDNGLSLINMMKSIEGGCRIVEGSLAGYGNRSGISDIYLLARMLIQLGYDIGDIDLPLLHQVTIEAEQIFLLVPSVYRSGSGLYEKSVTSGVLNIPDYLGDPTEDRTYSICADSLHPKTIISALEVVGESDEVINDLATNDERMNAAITALDLEFKLRAHSHEIRYKKWYDEMIEMFFSNTMTPKDVSMIIAALKFNNRLIA